MSSSRDGAPPEATQIDRHRLEELERGLEEARSRGAVAPTSAEPVPRVPAYYPEDEHQVVFAFLGGSSRKGSWEPAERVDCAAVMGGVNLDLREADLIEGTTTIRCFALWGGINIIVPPDVDVETHGTGILGGFEQIDHRAPDLDVPLIRVEGMALMGGVSVRVKERVKPKRASKRRWL